MTACDPLGLPPGPFSQRFPWIGADLQTLRDNLWPPRLPPDRAQSQVIALPAGLQPAGALLALLDGPAGPPRGLVLLVHGLAGSSQSPGIRRLALVLQSQGWAVLRLNLRGAGAGRPLASGTYAAACSSDLVPVLAAARQLAAALAPGAQQPLPLLAVGLSLGGTVLLNAVLAGGAQPPGLDGLACVSSPLDLALGSRQIERPRNRLYQRWLLRRLVAQTRADPQGLSRQEEVALAAAAAAGTIRAFDQRITAPRWGYGSVEAYYQDASPLTALTTLALGRQPLPFPLLLVHAADDPWVPVQPLRQLQCQAPGGLQILISRHGGHNGFHGRHDRPDCSWSDRVLSHWLQGVDWVPLAPGACASSHTTGP